MYSLGLLLVVALISKSYQQECTYSFQVPKEHMKLNCPKEDQENLKRKVRKLEETVFGVNYIRYGHNICPAGAKLIYDGYIGGSHGRHGGGSNYLCLPKEGIEMPEGTRAGFQSGSFIYGTEFEWHNGILSLHGKHDLDILCAVCDATDKSQKLMIPARKSCPDGWHLEYHGLLMTSHSGQHSKDFVCVDRKLKGRVASSANRNGAQLFVVEAVCGSLPCPPYEQGKEFACAICTK